MPAYPRCQKWPWRRGLVILQLYSFLAFSTHFHTFVFLIIQLVKHELNTGNSRFPAFPSHCIWETQLRSLFRVAHISLHIYHWSLKVNTCTEIKFGWQVDVSGHPIYIVYDSLNMSILVSQQTRIMKYISLWSPLKYAVIIWCKKISNIPILFGLAFITNFTSNYSLFIFRLLFVISFDPV